MARQSTKKAATTTTAATTAVSTPPAPFTRAPTNLLPFLDTLDRTRVYVVHIDAFPAAFKKRIFAVPVALNLAIAVLLAWRIYSMAPTYLAIFVALLGQPSPAAINTAQHETRELVWIVLKRSLMFMFDFLLVRFIGPWPLTFFLEAPANPCLWRWKNGFAAQEAAVRVSRGWGAEELVEGTKKGAESPFFKTRILPAVEKAYMRAKTAYLMMGKDWDLDFEAMIAAHQMVAKKELALEDFRKSVFVYGEAYGGWLCWMVYKRDEEGAEEESRRKIVMLKDRLTAMGKESLFFRWIEIVQYESNKEGEFTSERQQATLAQVEALFERQGVNFRELIESVGGMDGMPGVQAATS